MQLNEESILEHIDDEEVAPDEAAAANRESNFVQTPDLRASFEIPPWRPLLVLMATFLLTVFVDLTVAVPVGVMLSIALKQTQVSRLRET